MYPRQTLLPSVKTSKVHLIYGPCPIDAYCVSFHNGTKKIVQMLDSVDSFDGFTDPANVVGFGLESDFGFSCQSKLDRGFCPLLSLYSKVVRYFRELRDGGRFSTSSSNQLDWWVCFQFGIMFLQLFSVKSSAGEVDPLFDTSSSRRGLHFSTVNICGLTDLAISEI